MRDAISGIGGYEHCKAKNNKTFVIAPFGGF